MPPYEPPLTLTNTIVKWVGYICEAIGRIASQVEIDQALRLRKINPMLRLLWNLCYK